MFESGWVGKASALPFAARRAGKKEKAVVLSVFASKGRLEMESSRRL
jgi:hypothetical protein